MAVLLYVSQVYPWYFIWPLALAVLVGFGDGSSRAVVVFGLAFLPAYYLREFAPYGVFYVPIYAIISLVILGLLGLPAPASRVLARVRLRTITA
jgi:hypothetical protein